MLGACFWSTERLNKAGVPSCTSCLCISWPQTGVKNPKKSHYSAFRAGDVFIGKKGLVASSGAGLMRGVLWTENEKGQDVPFTERSALKP